MPPSFSFNPQREDFALLDHSFNYAAKADSLANLFCSSRSKAIDASQIFREQNQASLKHASLVEDYFILAFDISCSNVVFEVAP